MSTYTDVLSFVSSLAHGSVPTDAIVGYEFSGLDYSLALHALCPHAIDLSKLCWIPQPTPKQLDDNLVFFLECARSLDAPGAAAFPGEIDTKRFGGARRAVPPQMMTNNNANDNTHGSSQQANNADDAAGSSSSSSAAYSMLLFTPDTLQPSKQFFMHHMQVQQWLFRLQSQHRPLPLSVFDAQAIRRKYAMPVPLSQRCPVEMAEAFELVAAEKAGYRQCWREVENAALKMLARDAEVDMRKLNNVLLATQPTRVI